MSNKALTNRSCGNFATLRFAKSPQLKRYTHKEKISVIELAGLFIAVIAGAIAIVKITVSIRQLAISKEQLEVASKKLEAENEERKLQDLSSQSEQYPVRFISIPSNYFSNSPDISDELEKQSVQYISNEVKSNECTIFISGLGLDHRDFERHLRSLKNLNCLAISAYGFQPNDNTLYRIGIEEQVDILAYAISKIVSEQNFESINLVGFSIGADLILGIAETESLKISVNSLIALDPNVDGRTIFLSRRLTTLGNNCAPLDLVTGIGEQHQWKSLTDWIDVHRYLVSIFSKFGRSRIGTLQYFAQQIVEKYSEKEVADFSILLKKVAGKSKKLYVLFSDASEHKSIAKELVDLTPSNCVVRVEPGLGHFDLIGRLSLVSKRLQGKV